ncbi:MAG: transglycosylase SLT domain-containing protein [Mesorhizobium sp.]
MRIGAIAAAVAVAGCASAPRSINNVCAVFDQNDGWVTNWQRSANAASRRHGIPVPVLMATIRKESGFRSNARPPRKYYLGFIPGKRASSAYGYSQAIDGTWEQYRREAGGMTSRRNNFDDAIDFVGWYHARTAEKFGIAPHDAYNLYLAYYSGWTAYGRGSWRSNAGLQRTAREAAQMAANYDAQLRNCR